MNQSITLTIIAITSLGALATGCSQTATSRPSAAAAPSQVDDELELDVDDDADEGAEDGEESITLSKSDSAQPPRPFERVDSPLFSSSDEHIVLAKSVWVRAEPFADGAELGMIRGRRPIRYQSHVVNADCETPWVEVYPRGFVCVPAQLATEKEVARAERNKARRAGKKQKAMIGSYATAAKSARFFRSRSAAEVGEGGRPARGDMVRVAKSIKLEDGRTIWKTQRGEYVDRGSIRRLWGSKFRGLDLTADDAPALPFAFAVHRRSPKGNVPVRNAPRASARRVGKLRARTVVSARELSPDGKFIRVGENRWIARADARIVDQAEAPEDIGYAERWVDVDLDQQLVVVYAGEQPIYATLASTGRGARKTPTGTYRVTRKKRRTTMASDRSRAQSYSVAVPWATYFHGGYALHSAYWHDAFGKRKSHGCVNLSPNDALTVYSMVGPKLPDDWSVVYAHESQPGSVVRVRSAEREAEASTTEAVASR